MIPCEISEQAKAGYCGELEGVGGDGDAAWEVGLGTRRGHLEIVLTLICMTYNALLVHMACACVKKPFF